MLLPCRSTAFRKAFLTVDKIINKIAMKEIAGTSGTTGTGRTY